MELLIDHNEPEKSTQSNKFKPTSIMHDKALRQKRKELAKAYCIHVDWAKAAKEVGLTKKAAEDLFNKDQSFRRMVQGEMDRRAESLGLSAEFVLDQIKSVVMEARGSKDHRSALKGLELLGKHLKLFTEQKEAPNTQVGILIDLGGGEQKKLGVTIDGSSVKDDATHTYDES